MNPQNPENRLLLSMVNRISEKLPCNAGVTLSIFEDDLIVKQNVAALVEMSEYKIKDIINGLAVLLDDIGKAATNASSELNDRYLASQYILLKIISDCLTYYWKKNRETTYGAYFLYDPQNKYAHTHQKPTLNANRSGLSRTNIQKSSHTFTSSSFMDTLNLESTRNSSKSLCNLESAGGAAMKNVEDPPPLDDLGAKFLLNVISKFFFINSSTVNFDILGFNSSELNGDDMLAECQKPAGQILIYLSGSNWNVVFYRIRARLNAMSQTSYSDMHDMDGWNEQSNGLSSIFGGISAAVSGSAVTKDSVGGELTEIRMFEYLNLNRQRLAALLLELAQRMGHCRRQVHAICALTLRKAIWNWIEMYPSEFSSLCQQQKKLETAVDTLFEIFTVLSENAKRKQIYWPIQTILIVLCQDAVFEMVSASERNQKLSTASARKASFLADLKKSLKDKKYVDAAFVSLVDFAKASTYSPKASGGSAMRTYASGFETELKEKANEYIRLVASAASSNKELDSTLDARNVVDYLSSYWKLNQTAFIRTIIPIYGAENAPVFHQSVFIRSCYATMFEQRQLPWNPTVDSHLAGPLRRIFLENREKLTNDTTMQLFQKSKAIANNKNLLKRVAQSQVDEVNERLEILSIILRIWSHFPRLVVDTEEGVIRKDDFRTIIDRIIVCLFDAVPVLHEPATQVLKSLFHHHSIELWESLILESADSVNVGASSSTSASSSAANSEASTKASLRLYWQFSMTTLYAIGKTLVDYRDLDNSMASGPYYNARIKPVLELMREILVMRNEYLVQRENLVAVVGRHINERYVYSMIFEVVFLVFICNPDNEISGLAMQCLGLCFEESRLTGELALVHDELGQQGNMQAESTDGNLSASNDSIPDDTRSSQHLQPPNTGDLKRIHNTLSASGDGIKARSVSNSLLTQATMLTFLENSPVYMNLLSSYHGSGLMTGQKAQQKKIRKALKEMVSGTSGNVCGWEEIYKRWASLTAVMTKPLVQQEARTLTRTATPLKSEDTYEDRGEWHNFAGILCTMGGCIFESAKLWSGSSPQQPFPSQQQLQLQQQPSQLPQQQQSQQQQQQQLPLSPYQLQRRNSYGQINPQTGSSVNLSGVAGPNTAGNSLMDILALGTSGSSHDYAFLMQTARSHVEKFVIDLVDLLTCDNVMIREAVNQLLGTDLSPSLCTVLFGYLQITVSKLFEPGGEAIINERNIIQVENLITVIKLVVERAQECAEQLASIDLGAMLLSFAKFVNSLTDNPVQWGSALRIKVKLCQLIETLMSKVDLISIRHEIKVKNKLVESVMEWTSYFSMRSTDMSEPSEDLMVNGRNTKLLRDLNIGCLKAIVSLTAKLPLQPTDSTRESDMSDARSRLFHKYFAFLLKILRLCRARESMESSSIQNKELLGYLMHLREYVILALSNLLSANIDVGMKFSLPLGYADDTMTRAVFLHIFKNVLNTGTEFDGLEEGNQVLQGRYEKLLELLFEPSLEIVLCLADVAPVARADDVAKVLMNMFEPRKQSLPLLKAVIEREVSRTDSPSTLFRRNSAATKLLTIFSKIHGSEYLRATLQPLLTELAEAKEPLSFEVDTSRVSDPAVIQTNLKNLTTVSASFVDAILTSLPKMPWPLREICCYIWEAVAEKFSESRVLAVGGFLFLRFFNPAIVSPETHNLVKQPIQSKELRRGLILIGKIIQNLANNVTFGSKEAYMDPMNDLLSSYMGRVTQFLEAAATHVADDNNHMLSDKTPEQTIDQSDIHLMHSLLVENLEEMERSLHPRARHYDFLSTQEMGEGNLVEGEGLPQRTVFAKLSSLLVQLGPPPAVNKGSVNSSSLLKSTAAGQLYKDFMSRFENKNVDSIAEKGIFYDGGMSKEGRPILYFIANKLNPTNMDMELFIYFVLKCLESVIAKHYELVIDLTRFTLSNEIPIKWVTQFINIVSPDALQNLHAIYFYNTNTAFKVFSKKISRLVNLKLVKKVVFLTTLSELTEHITANELKLPKQTLQLEKDYNAFSPVTKIGVFKSQSQVILKVNQEYIQEISLKRQDILGTQANFNEIFHISELEDISYSSNQDEFFLKCDRGRVMVTFSSSKRDIIVKTIRAFKARYQLSVPSTIAVERVLGPNDVPGTMLNMAMLNIGSEDPKLRLAAYELLHSLIVIFNLDVGPHILPTKGLFIPSNIEYFVRDMSQKLALAEPGLTLEFLLEFCVSFYKSDRSIQLHALGYVMPWLKNLFAVSSFTYHRLSSGTYGADETIETRTQEEIRTQQKFELIIRNFVDLTIKDRTLFLPLQSKIWAVLAQGGTSIVPYLLDIFIQKTVDYGVETAEADLLTSLVITLATVNRQLVAGRIVNRLRKVITATSAMPMRSLIQHPSWPEICALVQFLLKLSFNNMVNVHQFLPEIFFSCSVLAGIGNPTMRQAIHAIVVNCTQSLCTLMPPDNANINALKYLLSEFSEPKFTLLFGLGGHGSMDRPVYSSEPTSADVTANIPLNAVESIINLFLDVMTYGGLTTDMSDMWRSRWMSLAVSSAFQYNPSVQPSAFIAIGCLAQTSIEDDLLYQILVALRNSILIFHEDDSRLVVSIVRCLCYLVSNLPTESRYFKTMFWLAMSLIQIGHIPIFQSALTLLQVVLKLLDERDCFAKEDLRTFLLKARAPIADVAFHLDAAVGVHFRTHFSFAIAANLMKGLKNHLTKTSTTAVLTTILEISCKNVSQQPTDGKISPDILGYLVPLLPITEKVKDLLWLAGVDYSADNVQISRSGVARYRGILDAISLKDDRTVLLVLAFMVSFLENSQYEREILFIYDFLADAVKRIPESFAVIAPSLIPTLMRSLSVNQTPDVVQAFQPILCAVLTSLNTSKVDAASYLEDVGFPGLPFCGSFKALTKDKKILYSQYAYNLVDRML